MKNSKLRTALVSSLGLFAALGGIGLTASDAFAGTPSSNQVVNGCEMAFNGGNYCRNFTNQANVASITQNNFGWTVGVGGGASASITLKCKNSGAAVVLGFNTGGGESIDSTGHGGVGPGTYGYSCSTGETWKSYCSSKGDSCAGF